MDQTISTNKTQRRTDRHWRPDVAGLVAQAGIAIVLFVVGASQFSLMAHLIAQP